MTFCLSTTSELSRPLCLYSTVNCPSYMYIPLQSLFWFFPLLFAHLYKIFILYLWLSRKFFITSLKAMQSPIQLQSNWPTKTSFLIWALIRTPSVSFAWNKLRIYVYRRLKQWLPIQCFYKSLQYTTKTKIFYPTLAKFCSCYPISYILVTFLSLHTFAILDIYILL